MYCAVCAPLTLYFSLNYSWHLGRALCRLTPSLQMSNVLVSCFSMALIAIDRWKFIVHSSSLSGGGNGGGCISTSSGITPGGGGGGAGGLGFGSGIDPERRSKLVGLFFSLALTWLLALSLSAPLALARDLRLVYLKATGELVSSACEEIWLDVRFKYVYSFVLIMFQYILPVFIIG